MSVAFDDLARSADRLSRRQIVKLGAGMAIAGTLPSWARPHAAGARTRTLPFGPPAHAAAGATGNCAIPKNPNCKLIAPGSDTCPGSRVVQSANPVTYNGCGSTSFKTSDNPLGLANFNAACNHHDCCYGQCNKPKADCDTTFHNEMIQACRSQSSGKDLLDLMALAFCLNVAGTYYEGVHRGAGGPYESAQHDSCGCCADCPRYQTYDFTANDCVSACKGHALGPDVCPCLPDRQTCNGPDDFYCTDLSSNPGDCGSCAHQCVRDNGDGTSQNGTCQGGQCVYPN